MTDRVHRFVLRHYLKTMAVTSLAATGLAALFLTSCQDRPEAGPSPSPEPTVATDRINTVIFQRDECTVYMVEDRGGNNRVYVATTTSTLTCSVAVE